VWGVPNRADERLSSPASAGAGAGPIEQRDVLLPIVPRQTRCCKGFFLDTRGSEGYILPERAFKRVFKTSLGPVGFLMSLAEIARRSNTSPATVSRVLSNSARVSPEVRRRVLDAVQETGYVPDASARALATKRFSRPGVVHRMIALAHGVTSRPAMTRHPYFEGVLEEAEEQNLSVTIASFKSEDLTRGAVPLSLARVKVDGILLRPMRGLDHALLRRVAPVVILGAAATEDSPFSTVEPDNGACLSPIVDHLAALGHRWVEFVPRQMDDPLYRRRCEVFLGRASFDGIRATVADTDFSRLDAYAAGFRARPASNRPTALFASSDYVAMDLIRRLHEHGLRVPEDVSVAGCDGQPLSESFLPALTTSLVPWREIGRCAVRKLVAEIEQPGPRTRTLLAGPLAVRQSTGPVPMEVATPPRLVG